MAKKQMENKPKLDRKKFIDEASTEWEGRSVGTWEHYLIMAISYMLFHRERSGTRSSLEAVGAAKVLKLAMRLREFSEELEAKGERGDKFDFDKQYDYIKDILDA